MLHIINPIQITLYIYEIQTTTHFATTQCYVGSTIFQIDLLFFQI